MSEFSFSVNEIKQELQNLGYKNVPLSKLLEFKIDLEKLVKEDEGVKQNILRESRQGFRDWEADDQSSVSTSTSGRRMKRKTLRKHAGKVSVQETYTTDDSVISFPISKTSSLQDLGSQSVTSCEERPATSAVIKSVSYESSCRLSNKTDPVSRYHEYQRFWKDLVIPGEKHHKQLRWQIRRLVGHYEPVVSKNKLLPVDFSKKLVPRKVAEPEWSFR